MKRRSMVLGLGALGTGSGAVFSSAALQNTATASGTLEVFSVGKLLVERGASTNPGSGKAYGVDYTSSVTVSSASDLPDAYVIGDTQNDSLDINAAVKNDNNPTITFEKLLKVTNQGTAEADVGFGFSGFGTHVGSAKDITKDSVKDAYDFKVSSGGNANISPTSGTADTEPESHKTVGPGNSFLVDLKIDLSVGSLVSEINTARDGSADPTFNGGNAGDSVTLINEVTVGTDDDTT